MTREEASKVLEMFLYKQCDLERTKFAYDDNTVWDAVKMASEALEQKPKTGHWIYQHDSFSEWNGFTLYFKCSECGRQIEINSDGKEKLLVIYPFCHCGADMRGEK